MFGEVYFFFEKDNRTDDIASTWISGLDMFPKIAVLLIASAITAYGRVLDTPSFLFQVSSVIKWFRCNKDGGTKRN